MEIRTNDQFQEICESVINGQHTQAVNQIIEFGFFASYLIEAIDYNKDAGTFYNEIECYFIVLIERATKERQKEKLKNILESNNIKTF